MRNNNAYMQDLRHFVFMVECSNKKNAAVCANGGSFCAQGPENFWMYCPLDIIIVQLPFRKWKRLHISTCCEEEA